MGIAPSRTELYLPSDTIRICSPDRCWCNGRHHNRSSKYVYVERGGDGRERYQDPVDMMGDFLMGGGGAAGMPWKNPGEWTVRDYERLGEVLNEWQMRERGRRRHPSSSGGNPMMMGGGGSGGMYGPSPWDAGGGSGGGGGGRRRRTHPSWGEFERMQETVEDKFRRMAEEYQRHLAERDSLLFGSASDHRREQYRNNMLKTLQEILPQLSQMMAAQQMGPGGMGMGMQNGMQGGMPGMAAMGGVNATPSMGMQGGGMGMGGMNMNPMMNPMAGAMGGGAGMGQMNNPMMPGGGGMNEFGGAGGFGRRGRLRRGRPFREDFEEDFGGGGGAGRRGAGRPFRRGRRSGWDDDDEDLLGNNFGGDDFSPRGPQGGPRRPRRPDGGNYDGGGIAHEDVGYGYRVDDPFRPAPPAPPRHAHFHTQHDYARSQGLDATEAEPIYDPDGDVDPMVPPLRRPSPYAPPEMDIPPDADIRPATPLGARHWPRHRTRQPCVVDGPPAFTSGTMGEAGPSSTRPDATARREAGFQPEARMSRPRDEETDRREPEAGAVPTKRDLL